MKIVGWVQSQTLKACRGSTGPLAAGVCVMCRLCYYTFCRSLFHPDSNALKFDFFLLSTDRNPATDPQLSPEKRTVTVGIRTGATRGDKSKDPRSKTALSPTLKRPKANDLKKQLLM